MPIRTGCRGLYIVIRFQRGIYRLFSNPEHPADAAADRNRPSFTADGGGYILAASHTVPPETPDDNIFAMCDEAGVTKEEIFDRAAHIRKKIEWYG